MKRTYKILLVALVVIFTGIYITKQNSKEGKHPKYIFYFIGDGFGVTQAELANHYLKITQGDTASLNMYKFPDLGLYETNCTNRYITGSAAAGTALSTGHKTSVNTIGMASDKKTPLKTIAEKLRDNGFKIGIVTSVSVDHATPAAFYAHQPSRQMYYNISLDMSKSEFNYFGGGGFLHPNGDGKINEDDVRANLGLSAGNEVKDKPSSISVAKKRGYKVVKTKSEFNNLKKGDDKVLVFAPRCAGGKSLLYTIDQEEGDLSLPELTQKGIELLDNSTGFFMMVEGGKIDWACHANDALTTIHEVLQFDASIKKAIEFYKKHPDETLIIVCGDHETGGLTLGYAGTHYESYHHILKNQKMSYEMYAKKVALFRKNNTSFSKAMENVEKNFGLGKKGLELTKLEMQNLKEAYRMSMIPRNKRIEDEAFFLKYGYEDPFTTMVVKTLDHKAGISWTTYSHTASPLPARATGVGSRYFRGFFDNTDVPKKIEKAAGLK